MAQTYTRDPFLGKAATWNPTYGYLSPWDSEPLNAPRTQSGDRIPGTSYSPTRGWQYQGESINAPRVAGSSVGSSFGSYGRTQTPAGTPSGTGVHQIGTLRNVKNPAIETQLTGLMGDYGKVRENTGTKDYVAALKAAAGDFKAAFDADLGLVNERLEGDVLRRQLGDLDKRQGALRGVMDLTAQYAQGRNNTARVMRGGGDSSYLRREFSRDLNDRLVPLALEQEDLGRGYRDQDYAVRLGLAGQPTTMRDAYLRRTLMPLAAEQAALGDQSALLARLQGLDDANSRYAYTMTDNAGMKLFSDSPGGLGQESRAYDQFRLQNWLAQNQVARGEKLDSRAVDRDIRDYEMALERMRQSRLDPYASRYG